jgi:hypothetical protein
MIKICKINAQNADFMKFYIILSQPSDELRAN